MEKQLADVEYYEEPTMKQSLLSICFALVLIVLVIGFKYRSEIKQYFSEKKTSVMDCFCPEGEYNSPIQLSDCKCHMI